MGEIRCVTTLPEPNLSMPFTFEYETGDLKSTVYNQNDNWIFQV